MSKKCAFVINVIKLSGFVKKYYYKQLNGTNLRLWICGSKAHIVIRFRLKVPKQRVCGDFYLANCLNYDL